MIATSSKPSYNERTGEVIIPFNYDFEHNSVEFDKRNANAFQRALTAMGPYSADAQPNSPILPLNSAAGMGLGALIGLAKELGGGKHTPGEVSVSMEKLRQLNPDAAATIETFNKTSAKKGLGESRTVSREQRRKILREVKQPYVLPETKKEKYKPNFKGKFSPQNTPDVTASPESDYMVRAKNAAGQTWRTKDKYWAGYETTERLNVVYDQVGHGQMYWDNLVKENQEKKNVRDRKIQEHLNILAHNRAMNKLDSNYESPFNANDKIEEQETLQADNDPLFRKVAKSLKKEIDYQDKPAKPGISKYSTSTIRSKHRYASRLW